MYGYISSKVSAMESITIAYGIESFDLGDAKYSFTWDGLSIIRDEMLTYG